MFEYPHQTPTHHIVDNLPVEEQQELQKIVEAKAKQEKGKKGKPKKKTKLETSETGDLDLQIPTVTPLEVRDIQPRYTS